MCLSPKSLANEEVLEQRRWAYRENLTLNHQAHHLSRACLGPLAAPALCQLHVCLPALQLHLFAQMTSTQSLPAQRLRLACVRRSWGPVGACGGLHPPAAGAAQPGAARAAGLMVCKAELTRHLRSHYSSSFFARAAAQVIT